MEFQQKYLDLFIKYHKIFSTIERVLGPSNTEFHDIQLSDKEPVCIKQFQIPEAHWTAVPRRSCERNAETRMHLIYLKQVQQAYLYCSAKNGRLRIVQDFWALNKKTVSNQHSMKDIQEHINEIGKKIIENNWSS